MTRSDWVRITTAFRKRFDAQMDHAIGQVARREPPTWTLADRERCAAVAAEYFDAIVATWRAYRPTGPLDGEVVPHEVKLAIARTAN